MTTTTLSDSDLRSGEHTVNGVRLHIVATGSGEPVVLLHGFPEFWWGWRNQMPALASAGFRAVAPDLRGYDRSEKPTAISAYRTERLVGDVVGLIRSLGVERASVVGHDWGGVIAWHLAMTHPERVKRLAILNAPHPALLKRELATLGQLLRSWYVFFFQIPWLPEAVIRAGNFRALERAFRTSTVRPDVFSAAEIDRYKEALARPGALTAAINYYRASFREAWGARGFRPTPVPTLLIWGERDLALNVRFTQGLSDWVPDLRIERLPDVGHFVQHEAPDTVNRLLVEFLRG